MINLKFIFIISILFSISVFGNESFIQFEGALLYQGRNDQRIPGNTGSHLSFDEFDRGPFNAFRIYYGKNWSNRHEFRLLYAPLKVEAQGNLNQTTNFNGVNFPAGVVHALYKFNSYRLTYAYQYMPIGNWTLKLGGTLKIRDAEVALTQGNLSSSKKNVGFVPLLNFQAINAMNEVTKFRFDFDGLAAPQGRAFDVAFFLERELHPHFSILFGYRMVEGGADNDIVYNMAWFHYATIGMMFDF